LFVIYRPQTSYYLEIWTIEYAVSSLIVNSFKQTNPKYMSKVHCQRLPGLSGVHCNQGFFG